MSAADRCQLNGHAVQRQNPMGLTSENLQKSWKTSLKMLWNLCKTVLQRYLKIFEPPKGSRNSASNSYHTICLMYLVNLLTYMSTVGTSGRCEWGCKGGVGSKCLCSDLPIMFFLLKFFRPSSRAGGIHAQVGGGGGQAYCELFLAPVFLFSHRFSDVTPNCLGLIFSISCKYFYPICTYFCQLFCTFSILFDIFSFIFLFLPDFPFFLSFFSFLHPPYIFSSTPCQNQGKWGFLEKNLKKIG